VLRHLPGSVTVLPFHLAMWEFRGITPKTFLNISMQKVSFKKLLEKENTLLELGFCVCDEFYCDKSYFLMSGSAGRESILPNPPESTTDSQTFWFLALHSEPNISR